MTAQLLKEARERRAEHLQKVKGFGEKIQARSFSEETDGPALEAAQNDLTASEKEVQRLETMLDAEARSAGWVQTATQAPAYIPSTNMGDKTDNLQRNYSFLSAIRAASGQEQMTGLVKEMHEEAIKEMTRAGVSNYSGGVLVPQLMQQRDMTAGTTTAGGFTIQTDVAGLIPFLDPRPVIARMGATMLSGLTGNIDFPRNDTAAAAVWEAEQGAADETSPTFDRVQMSPKRLAAFSEISMQVLRQSSIAMENFVRGRLMNARDNALDTAALSPQAGSAPTGIVGTAGVNTITIAASPTWAKIVQFETEIAADNADFGNLAYLTTPSVAGILKTKIRDAAGNGFIWEGPNNGSGTVNGYRAFVSNLVPTTGGAHYMFFGNWSEMLIGQWGGMEIMTDPYTRLKEATIQVVLNCWHDIAIRHGQSFAYSTSVHPS